MKTQDDASVRTCSLDSRGGGLFEDWLPPWIEGETLFAWCSRYHRLAGHRLAEVTSDRLFGDGRSGLSHDLPGHLGVFAERTRGLLGLPEELAILRTVLGYYLSVQSFDVRANALLHLQHASAGALKAKLGWLATRVGAAHPLKACEACLAEQHGYETSMTWMLVHQLPGVWACPMHRTGLWFTSDLLLHARRRWLLPNDVPYSQHVVLDELDLQDAALVAEATLELIEMTTLAPLDRQRIANALWHRLESLGLASGGRLAARECGQAYARFLSKFSRWPEADALCISESAAETVLRRILAVAQRATHPLRYITVVLWLYGRWSNFCQAYEAANAAQRTAERGLQPVPTGKRSLSTSPAWSTVVSAVADCRRSVRSAAVEAGVSIGTALLWVQQAGLATTCRPKWITPDVRSAATRMLATGKTKVVIAQRLSISITSVTRILLAQPALKKCRDDVIFKIRQRQARSAWQRVTTKFPEGGTSSLRKLRPKAYAWLYRNDPEWLLSNLPSDRAAPTQPGRVDWRARDRDFATQIKRYIASVRPRLPSRVEVFRSVSGLALKIKHLDRLPKTSAALGAVTGRADR